jgi:dihydroorotate dehydrogenase (NAD+) catalytic subunit
MKLSTDIAGLKLRTPVMNTSGVFSLPPVLKRVSPFFGAVVLKSIGAEERNGYETPVFAQLGYDRFINAVGLPNPGYIEIKKELEEIYPLEIPLIVSIFGSTGQELAKIAEHLQDVCDAFEINYSCPHPKPGERIGMLLGSDSHLVKEYTKDVRDVTKKPIIAKLSPNINNLLEVAGAAIDGGSEVLSGINTVGPVESTFMGIPVLSNVKGGLSGACIKSRGLDFVHALRRAFPEIPIIGMGGIYTAQDVADYLSSGANAVAMGTAFDLMNTEQVGEHMNDIYRKLGEWSVQRVS